MKEHHVPGVSYLIVNDSGTIIESAAFSDRDDELITPGTLFQAASISKPVAAIGIMACAVDKGIDLDDNLRPRFARYDLVFSGYPDKPITLRQLLSHSAGFDVHGFAGYPEDRYISTGEILRGNKIDKLYYRQVDKKTDLAELLNELKREANIPIILKQGDRWHVYGQDGESFHIKELQRPARIPNPFKDVEFPNIVSGTQIIPEANITNAMKLDILANNGHALRVNNPPLELTDEPGQKFKYSGGGITLAQFLVEKLVEEDGLDFEGAMKKYVFDKLDMRDSTFRTPATDRRSKAHNAGGSPLETTTGAHVYPESAAAGLWTTPTDLAKILAEMESGYKEKETKVLTPSQIQEMLSPQIEFKYPDGSKGHRGLGFEIHYKVKADGSLDLERFGHGGVNMGFRTFMDMRPEDGVGIVIMTNGENGDVLCGEILNQFDQKYLKKAEPISDSHAKSSTKSADDKQQALGNIILLCGTSTAGKTSICTAALTEAAKTGHSWHIDGADLAGERAWKEPSTIDGNSYPSGEDHFVSAMKEHAGLTVVDRAVGVFGARTLAVALLSKQNLGNPKVDKVSLTPSGDLKEQARKIHGQLSPENKEKYSPNAIEDLLTIIRDCPETGKFLEQHPYLPLQKINEQMLDKAVARARAGESTILDVVGNETIDSRNISEQLKERIKDAGLPLDTCAIEVAHCPLDTLRDRIDGRNARAIEEGKPEDIRKAFFPFQQYGDLYERAPNKPGDLRPRVGKVHKKDIIAAAAKYGHPGDAGKLLEKLGFNDGESSIEVVARVKSDLIFQTGQMNSQQIAEQLCARAFGTIPERSPLASQAFGEEKSGVNSAPDRETTRPKFR
ncbi:MAG: beta-lactamase family protein [Rickettsiaceae bacterium]|nr:beta-lactamase family protein [Rickettsiaceae bacterium]